MEYRHELKYLISDMQKKIDSDDLDGAEQIRDQIKALKTKIDQQIFVDEEIYHCEKQGCKDHYDNYEYPERYVVFQEGGSGIVVYSADSCPWCNRAIPVLNEMLKTVKVASFYVAIVLLLKKIGVVELRLFFVFYESVGMMFSDALFFFLFGKTKILENIDYISI